MVICYYTIVSDDRQTRLKVNIIDRLEHYRVHKRQPLSDIISNVLDRLEKAEFELSHPRQQNGLFKNKAGK